MSHRGANLRHRLNKWVRVTQLSGTSTAERPKLSGPFQKKRDFLSPLPTSGKHPPTAPEVTATIMAALSKGPQSPLWEIWVRTTDSAPPPTFGGDMRLQRGQRPHAVPASGGGLSPVPHPESTAATKTKNRHHHSAGVPHIQGKLPAWPPEGLPSPAWVFMAFSSNRPCF